MQTCRETTSKFCKVAKRVSFLLIILFGCLIVAREATKDEIFEILCNTHDSGKPIHSVKFRQISQTAEIREWTNKRANLKPELPTKKPTIAYVYSNKTKTDIIYDLVGRNISFNLSADQIQEIVENNVINTTRALLLWEFLVRKKSRESEFFIDKISLTNSIFNFASNMALVANFVMFLVVIRLQKSLTKVINEEKEIFTHLLIILIQHCLSDVFYCSNCLIACSISIIHVLWSLKLLFETFYGLMGGKRDDVDIFVENEHVPELAFIYRLVTYCTVYSSSFCLCLTLFPYIFNFLIYYNIVMRFIPLIQRNLQPTAMLLFQPLKSFLFIFLGVLNFIFTAFYRKTTFDSFYPVSDFFTLYFLLNGVKDYTINKVFNTSHFYYDTDESIDTCKRINEQIKTAPRFCNNLTDDEWLFLVPFFFFLVGMIYSANINNYFLYSGFSYFMWKSIRIFHSVYKIVFFRPFFSFFIIAFCFLNFKFNNVSDFYLSQLSYLEASSFVIINLVYTSFNSCCLVYYILSNFEFFYFSILENKSQQEVAEKKMKKKIMIITINRPSNQESLFLLMEIIQNTITFSIIKALDSRYGSTILTQISFYFVIFTLTIRFLTIPFEIQHHESRASLTIILTLALFRLLAINEYTSNCYITLNISFLGLIWTLVDNKKQLGISRSIVCVLFLLFFLYIKKTFMFFCCITIIALKFEENFSFPNIRLSIFIILIIGILISGYEEMINFVVNSIIKLFDTSADIVTPFLGLFFEFGRSQSSFIFDEAVKHLINY